MATRVLTWNVQGRARPDLGLVREVIAAATPDVVALQEVQRSQARALARQLGWSVAWRFKHWSVVVRPEGLALLSPRPLTGVTRTHLAHRVRFWSWRRRIALRAVVEGPDGPVVILGTHLGAGVGDAERTRQAHVTVEALRAGAAGVIGGCVVGDLNAHPGSPVLAAYAAAGLRDAWEEVGGGEPGATNWAPGPRDEPPTQRLDYALVTEGFDVVSVWLPSPEEAGFERYGRLSDHLPLSVTLAPVRSIDR